MIRIEPVRSPQFLAFRGVFPGVVSEHRAAEVGYVLTQREFAVDMDGTEGDARPFAALCRGQMDTGHEARLLADAATLGSAQALGVPSVALSGDVRGTLSRDHAIAGVVAKGGGFNQSARALAKTANENAESWLRTIIEAGAGCDAILAAGLAGFVGFSAAEYLGAKGIGAGLIPIMPTSAFPSPFLPPKWVPRPVGAATVRKRACGRFPIPHCMLTHGRPLRRRQLCRAIAFIGNLYKIDIAGQDGFPFADATVLCQNPRKLFICNEMYIWPPTCSIRSREE